MGSPPQVRAPSGAALSTASMVLALVASVTALMVPRSLARDSHPEEESPPPPPMDCDEDNPDNPNFNSCCHHVPPGFPRPHWCERPPHESSFYLVAQIALGTALVVAVAALINIVLRTCTSRRRRRNQQRTQFRPAGASNTSLDMYVRERMHDCPPCYDEISWEKPPSYANLPIIEPGAAEGPDRREPPPLAPCVPNLSEPAGAASQSPPCPGAVFTISQHVEQPAPPPAADDAGKEAAPADGQTAHA